MKEETTVRAQTDPLTRLAGAADAGTLKALVLDLAAGEPSIRRQCLAFLKAKVKLPKAESAAALAAELMALWDELEPDLAELDEYGGGYRETEDNVDTLLYELAERLEKAAAALAREDRRTFIEAAVPYIESGNAGMDDALINVAYAACADNADLRHLLEQRLLYGSYPEVVLTEANEERELYLRELVSSYLFKDILELEDVRHCEKLRRLLQLLAFQIGKDVSVTELGTQLGMSKNTVDRYLDLLEKVFVIYARAGFSRNLRKEITKSRRYYFVDNGIRNALISNFNPLALRDDAGALWENYVCGERLKANLYRGRTVQSHYWRTYDQQELDLVEETGGHLTGIEMKWASGTHRCPTAWAKAYPDASFQAIHRDNYLPFIT